MKKNLKVLLLLLIASILIMACGLSQTAPDEPAVADAGDAPVEEVASPIPVEEPTAIPTAIPDMDISEVVLVAADFPDVAFQEVSLEEMGMSAADLNSEEFTVESFFALLEPTNFEMIMGFTTLVQSPLDKAGFDLVLNQPDVLIKSFLGGMGDTGTSEPQELPEFTDTIGDSSAGMTVVTDIEGMGMRLDVVVFRHDSIGTFVITMYLDGQEPPVSLMDAATKFDEKIAAFLASQ